VAVGGAFLIIVTKRCTWPLSKLSLSITAISATFDLIPKLLNALEESFVLGFRKHIPGSG
jgi:hypothetical protein